MRVCSGHGLHGSRSNLLAVHEPVVAGSENTDRESVFGEGTTLARGQAYGASSRVNLLARNESGCFRSLPRLCTCDHKTPHGLVGHKKQTNVPATWVTLLGRTDFPAVPTRESPDRSIPAHNS